jgi:hypothetical protein
VLKIIKLKGSALAMRYFIVICLLVSSFVVAQEKRAKVSFKKEIMPVLIKKCMGCHNTEDEGPSGLYLDDYKELMKGDSKHGPVIKSGNGEESLFILKLKGTAKFGKQMPRGKIPLDDETIEMISTWIDQGAKNN